jgi:hypothetical protein
MSSDLISPGLSRLGQVFRVYRNNISAMSCTTTLILGDMTVHQNASVSEFNMINGR